MTIVGNDSGGAVSQILVTEHARSDRPSRPDQLRLLREVPAAAVQGDVQGGAGPRRRRGPGRARCRSARSGAAPLAYGGADREADRRDAAALVRRPARPTTRASGATACASPAAPTRATRWPPPRSCPTCEIPVLLAWGADDRFFTLEDARRLAELIPDAGLVEIAGAKTFVIARRARRVADEIASFVAERPLCSGVRLSPLRPASTAIRPPRDGANVIARRVTPSARRRLAEAHRAQRRPQHDLHLEQREAGAEAAAHAAAEGDPLVGPGRIARGSAPGGTRAGRGRCRRGGAAGRSTARCVTPAGSSQPPISIGAWSAAHDGRHDGPQAQRLLDRRRRGTRSPPSALLGDQLGRAPSGVRTRRSSAQASAVAVVSWPATSSVISSSRSSESVSGSPVLVARGEQQREDVVAVGAVRVGAARADLLVEQGVGLARARRRSAPRGCAARCGRRSAPASARARRLRDHVEQAPQRRADPLAPLAVVDAEDRAHDHLERDRLHARQDREARGRGATRRRGARRPRAITSP